MSYNVEEGSQLAINTFGGLITEVPPSNVPETGSPDNQDCQFWPGAVGSRFGLRRVFAALGSPPVDGTITYAKSFVDPLGVIRNLYLDSEGNMWVENISTSAGTAVLLTTTTPGSYAKSITAFGREYIAISDGLHGTDIPLQYDGTNLDRVTQDGPGAPPTVTNTIIAATSMTPGVAGFTMVRGFSHPNVVEVYTATPHGLQVGYQALITGVSASPVNFISSLVINNEDAPGIATVTVSAPHGLKPGSFAILRDIGPEAIGGGLTNISRNGGFVIFGTNTPHNLSVGAVVLVTGCSDSSFNTFFTVSNILDAATFGALQADSDASATGGTVSIVWPVSSTESAPAYFEVLAVPTDTSFQVAVSYSSGTWTTGDVFFAWDGTFFVTEVVNPTTFRYQQYGPDSATTDVGTVTPHGQISPGVHQMQVLFLTRQGYITKPSPPVQFIANGGQYLTVSDIPIGPSNIQARILAFTGALGASFYYIPVPAQVNGQVVSTATQIDHNTTTSVVLDFSDNTLYAALGINILGNNLPAQIILDGALGFTHFGSRLTTYGQRNRIQNLLNMSFDGGYFPSDPTMPTGWLAVGSPPDPGGILTTSGHYGDAWEINSGGSIYQSFYLDAYGAPIATPRAQYTARAWIKGAGPTITLTISSATSGFTSSVTLAGISATGSWVEGDFSAAMPDSIPTDMILSLTGSISAIVDEISIIYTSNPYLDTVSYGSYVNNPEGFDGLSGKFGAANDTRKQMAFGLIRGTLFLLTRDPTGRLHAIIDNGTTEPAGWSVNQVATSCGCISAFGLTVSQADDASGGGGEEWIAWASYAGARIFGGDQPWKITQEIQPDWDTINPAAVTRVWACNDPYNRVIYFGLPVGTATAPSLIYPVDYKGLDTAFQIGQAAPVYRGQGGKMAAGEFCRKWTRWNLTMNGAALMYRQDSGQLFITFFAGNGLDPANPGSPPIGGFGNVYILCADAMTDDDFGQIRPYYVTYFFPSHILEQVLGIGTQRKMLEFFQYLATGVGELRVSFLCNSLTNVWPLNCIRDLSLDPQFDIEHPGSNATGQRIAFKFEGLPSGTV